MPLMLCRHIVSTTAITCLCFILTGCGRAAQVEPERRTSEAWSSEWVPDGEDTRLRIDGVKIVKPKMKGHEFEWIHERLQVTLRIENTSLRKKGIWTPPLPSDAFLEDTHTNLIASRTDEIPQGWEGTLVGPQLLDPGSPISHLLFFDKPTADSGHMKLTVHRGDRKSIQLTIPPYALPK